MGTPSSWGMGTPSFLKVERPFFWSPSSEEKVIRFSEETSPFSWELRCSSSWMMSRSF